MTTNLSDQIRQLNVQVEILGELLHDMKKELDTHKEKIEAFDLLFNNLPDHVINAALHDIKEDDQFEQLKVLDPLYYKDINYVRCTSLSRHNRLDEYLYELLDFIKNNVDYYTENSGKICYGNDYIEIEYEGWASVTMRYQKKDNKWSLNKLSSYDISGRCWTEIITDGDQWVITVSRGKNPNEITRKLVMYNENLDDLFNEIKINVEKYQRSS